MVYVLTQVHKDSGIRKLARIPLVLEVLKFSNKDVLCELWLMLEGLGEDI